MFAEHVGSCYFLIGSHASLYPYIVWHKLLFVNKELKSDIICLYTIGSIVIDPYGVELFWKKYMKKYICRWIC